MTIRTNFISSLSLHPTILESEGKPAFVVLPYDEYVALADASSRFDARIPANDAIPQEVLELKILNGWTFIRAWREFLGITQAQMADRLKIRQPTYRVMESPGKRQLRASTIARIAHAMGLSEGQLNL